MWLLIFLIIVALLIYFYNTNNISKCGLKENRSKHIHNGKLEKKETFKNITNHTNNELLDDSTAENEANQANTILSHLITNKNNVDRSSDLSEAIDIYISKNKKCISKNHVKARIAFNWYLRKKLNHYIRNTCNKNFGLKKKEKRKLYHKKIINIINKAPPCREIINFYLRGVIIDENDTVVCEESTAPTPRSTPAPSLTPKKTKIPQKTSHPRMTLSPSIYPEISEEESEAQEEIPEEELFPAPSLYPEEDEEEETIIHSESESESEANNNTPYPTHISEVSTPQPTLPTQPTQIPLMTVSPDSYTTSYPTAAPPYAQEYPKYYDDTIFPKGKNTIGGPSCCSSITHKKKQEPGWMYIPEQVNEAKKRFHTKKNGKPCSHPVPSLTHGYPSLNLQFHNIDSEECNLEKKEPNCLSWGTVSKHRKKTNNSKINKGKLNRC